MVAPKVCAFRDTSSSAFAGANPLCLKVTAVQVPRIHAIQRWKQKQKNVGGERALRDEEKLTYTDGPKAGLLITIYNWHLSFTGRDACRVITTVCDL